MPLTRSDRRHTAAIAKVGGGDIRTAAQHDRDRLLYSPEFRRLSGITQVISPGGNYPTHNRLTHTLEVAQIARSIASNLLARYSAGHNAIDRGGGLDPDIVEAAALAHDIGHPPFGHVTETVLNQLLRDKGYWGFEGNAQTFRILTKLSVKDDTYEGLNLTRATLSAVSKYPWFEGRDETTKNKWGAYESERVDLEFSRAHLPAPLQTASQRPTKSLQTLEARIMDWADDVAYAVHDVDDFFRVGMIPLDRLKSDSGELARFLDYHLKRVPPDLDVKSPSEIEEIGVRLLQRESPFLEPYTGTTGSAAELHRRSSFFVHRYIMKVDLYSGTNNSDWNLVVDPEARIEVDLLKSLLWYYVIENRALISLRYGYASLIEELFERLRLAAMGPGRQKDHRIFPEFFRARLQNDDSGENVFRLIADFIASLTEQQTIDLHHRLTGIAFGKSLDQIV